MLLLEFYVSCNIMLQYFGPFYHMRFLHSVTRQQVKANLTRLHSCVEELRSLPTEGCTRPQVEVLKQAVLDSLQQYKHYARHANLGNNLQRGSVEVRTCYIPYMLMDG